MHSVSAAHGLMMYVERAGLKFTNTMETLIRQAISSSSSSEPLTGMVCITMIQKIIIDSTGLSISTSLHYQQALLMAETETSPPPVNTSSGWTLIVYSPVTRAKSPVCHNVSGKGQSQV